MESLPADMRSTLPPGADADVDEFKASLMCAKKKSKPKKAMPAEMQEDHLMSSDPLGQKNTHAPMAADVASVAQERDAKYAKNPELSGDRKKYSIVPPSIHREGNKKTLFANLAEICKRMNRPQEHVTMFLFSELGTTGSTDAKQQLIIKGRFQQKQIENVLKHYIMEYVTCKTCKSPNTILKREHRLFFQQCEACGSTRSVSAIKTGFKAQTEKRASQRNREAS